ncbi:MAG TPA: amidohydrolase family protein [Acidobacteriota bacterium]|nr:amidohydrolase family protein [Acidobacteriota bacterium]HNG93662.1 amidohydrolase family protein [Acidobacteriota bacterium]HNH81919.1 amidohydrolase family protein [Acidobacteriota bacterium]
MKIPGILCILLLLFSTGQPQTSQLFAGQKPVKSKPSDLALVGAKIYPSPSENPIEKGVIVIRNGKISAIGELGKVKLPAKITTLDCTGMTITAGFWNCHVHFSELKWEESRTLPAAQLTGQLQEMLTRYGFTSVFDTGSYWEITSSLRQRIESGEVDGPQIFTTGEILFPKNGVPPLEAVQAAGGIARPMPEAQTSEQAVQLVTQKLKAGTDGVKLYAQTFWNPNLKIPVDIIKAVTAEAHRQHKPVFVHPSNQYGLEAAIESGVDVLVHTTPQTGPWDATIVGKMKQAKMALVPTLTLWHIELEREGAPPEDQKGFQTRGVNQLRAYFQAGGQILFGTDVGYIPVYDTTEEFEQMERAGMRFSDILAALTTAPAGRFGKPNQTGKIAAGTLADLVVLESDPGQNIRAFSKVKFTLRNGKIIFQSK